MQSSEISLAQVNRQNSAHIKQLQSSQRAVKTARAEYMDAYYAIAGTPAHVQTPHDALAQAADTFYETERVNKEKETAIKAEAHGFYQEHTPQLQQLAHMAAHEAGVTINVATEPDPGYAVDVRVV